MQHRRRVGRVAEQYQIRAVGDQTRIECPRFVEKHLGDRHTRRTQDHLRFGERRLDQRGMPDSKARKHLESVGRASQEQYGVSGAAMGGCDGIDGGLFDGAGGIAGEVGQRVGDGGADKFGRPTTHIDGEIDEPRHGVGVAMSVQCMQTPNVQRQGEQLRCRCNPDVIAVDPTGSMECVTPPVDSSSPASSIDPRDPSIALLVDLDGTITDSFTGIANSFRHALDEVGAPPAPDEVIAGIAGPPMLDTLNSLGLGSDTADAALAAYRRHYTEIGWLQNAVFDGMGELLADLAAAGRTMAVATSKNQRTAQRILDHFGLAEHFAVIAGASDDHGRRTKAAVIEYALAELGLAAPGPRAVMIGDRHHDIDGAAAFGIPTILVGWGYALPGEGTEPGHTATWRVNDVDDLRKMVGGESLGG